MPREINKTQTMREIFTAQLNATTAADLAADRGRAFRAACLADFNAQYPDNPSVAPVLYNVVRKENLESGALVEGVIGRRPKGAPEIDLTLPWAVTADGNIVQTYPGRAAAREAKVDGQRVQKTVDVLS